MSNAASMRATASFPSDVSELEWEQGLQVVLSSLPSVSKQSDYPLPR